MAKSQTKTAGTTPSTSGNDHPPKPPADENKPATQEYVDKKAAETQQHFDERVDEVTDAAANLVEECMTFIDAVQVTHPQINALFTQHKPDAEQEEKMDMVRRACAACAQVIKNCVPNSADQTAAIRKVREAMYTAKAGIVCHGK